MEILKVSSKSNPNKVAGAISNILKDYEKLEIQVIGAGALNQAIKSIVIARGYLAPIGKEIYIIPSFNELLLEGNNRTAIKLTIEIK